MYFYLSLLTKIQLINYKEFLVWINLELICVKVKRAKIQKHRSRLSVKRYWNLWRHFRNQRWDLKEKHSLKWSVMSTRRQSKLITYRWLRWGRGESMILERMGRWGCWGTYLRSIRKVVSLSLCRLSRQVYNQVWFLRQS